MFRHKPKVTFSPLFCLAFHAPKPSIVAIIFSAFTLEAYINNYAARKGLEKHLKGLGFVSKWIEIPKLATGKEFPKDQQCFQYLEELKNLRNELAHSKSKVFQFDDHANIKQISDDVYSIVGRAEKAVETIFRVIRCLTEIDSGEKQYLSGATTDMI